MPDSGLSWRDYFDLSIRVFTATSILVAARSFMVNKKQLNVSTISRCISDFKELRRLDTNLSEETKIHNYLELVNEELFYFQYRYLPIEIGDEWIDGMIDLIPLTNKEGQILNPKNCLQHLLNHKSKYLRNYPRIVRCFTLIRSYDWDAVYNSDPTDSYKRVYERKRMTIEILENLGAFRWYDIGLRRRILNQAKSFYPKKIKP